MSQFEEKIRGSWAPDEWQDVTVVVAVSGGPDADTDWPWTNWANGLQVLRNPQFAGRNSDGGAFFNPSNGLNSSGDILVTSAKVYQ